MSSRIPSFRRSIAALACFVTGFAGLSVSAAQAGVNETFPKVLIVKTEDGQAPFDATAGPGNDTGNNNGEVRAGQLTKYKLNFSVTDSTVTTDPGENRNNVTFTSDELPLGVVWDKRPSTCLVPGSSISGDGIATPSVLLCNMGTWTTGSAWVVTANVRALPSAEDGTKFVVSGTLTATDVPRSDSASSEAVVVRTQPRIDLVKNAPIFFGAKKIDGVDGYVYAYGMGVKYRPGSETVKLPMTWSDDYSSVHPDAKFLGCTIAGTNEPVSGFNVWAIAQPLGKLNFGAWNGDFRDTKARAVQDSGRISCTDSGGNVSVSVDGVATNPDWYPTEDFASPGTALTPGDNWIGSYVMTVWIPSTAFNTGNDFNFRAENRLNDFAPVGGTSGNPNFADPDLEPGRKLTNEDVASETALIGTQNWYESVIYRPSPGSFDKNDYQFSDGITAATFAGDTTGGTIWGAFVGSGYKSGDGVLAATNKYAALNELYFSGIIDIPVGFTNCMTYDNRYTTVEALPGQPTRGAFVWSGTPASTNTNAGWVVEYGTGGPGGSAATTWASDAERKAGTCDDTDSSSPWTADLTAVVGGPTAITKVRARSTSVYTVAEQLSDISSPNSYGQAYARFAVLLKVQPTAPGGVVAANYQKVKDPSGTWFTGWRQPSYVETTALGDLGDRITVVGTRVRTAKKIAQNTYRAGTQQDWTLDNTSDAMGILPAGQALNVKLVDTIPTELSYVVGSAVCTAAVAAPVSCEPTVVNNAGGTQTLSWNFGSFTAGSTMSSISFKTDSESVIQDGASRVNNVIISADNDNSPESFRTAKATANFSNPAAFNASKRVLTPLVEKGDPITYRLTYGNTSPEAKLTSDFIDWLPHNGDPRTPKTVHDGTMEFVSAVQISGAQTTTLEYSKEPYANLVAPIPNGSQGDYRPLTIRPAIVWCAALLGGTCPASAAEVTGFRIKGSSIAPGQKTVYELTMKPKATALDKVGNLFTNRFMGDVDGIDLPIESNNVTARVIGSSIGDTYFHDLNKNGIQDAGEPGIPGATVQLFDNAGTEIPVGPDGLIDTADDAIGGMLTDSNGKYKFGNLHSGDYKVGFSLPAGSWVRTTAGAGSDRTLDSDASVADGLTSTISLGINATRTDIDAGVWKLAKLSGHVYVDPNQDGSHGTGPNDRPLFQIRVTLKGTDADGLLVDRFVDTDANGFYEFTNLVPGTYSVSEGTVSDTTLDDALDRAGSKGGTVTNEKISAITIASGDDAINYDFTEVVAPASLAGSVKVVGTGVAIEGVAIKATNTTTGEVFTTTTDNTGAYSFPTLPAGTYNVTETQPAGYNDAADTVGTGATTAGTAGNDALTGVVLSPRDKAINYDFTETVTPALPVNLSGSVKVNGTGAPIDNVTIKITNTATGEAFTTTTNNTGAYSFVGLPAGTYNLAETQPAGYNDSIDSVGTGAATPGTGTNDAVTGIVLTPGQSAINYDFTETVIPPASISGSVKVNGSGDPIANVKVTLTNTATGVTTETTTDDTGAYSFTNLAPGTYTVKETQPSTFVDGPDSLGTGATTAGTATNDQFAGVVLGGGQNAVNYDFTENKPASISGAVYVAGTNTPIAGVTITLKNETTNLTTTTTTGLDGKYSFTGLPAGTYSVTETQPSGFDDAADKAGTGATGAAGTVGADSVTGITVVAGDKAVDYDFTETPTPIPQPTYASLAGQVYVAGSGRPIGGVTVTLTGTTPAGVTTVYTTTTDANGAYFFGNLPAGTYRVVESQPAGYSDDADVAGNKGGTAGNDSITDIKLVGGDVATGYDFTERADIVLILPQSTISGRVLVSDDGSPIAGVVIRLTGTDVNGVRVELTAITDANGNYSFNPPASSPAGYTLTQEQPFGFVDDADVAGTGGGTAGNDVISSIVLPSGAALTGYNFTESRPKVAPTTPVVVAPTTGTGISPNPVEPTKPTKPATPATGTPAPAPTPLTPTPDSSPVTVKVVKGLVDGTVYEDKNRNKTFDENEKPIAGVAVRLTDSSGRVIETTTDADGRYQFTDVPDGEVTIEVLTVQKPVGGSKTFVVSAKGPETVVNIGYATSVVKNEILELSLTGSSLSLLFVSLGLLGAGFVFLLGFRRREDA